MNNRPLWKLLFALLVPFATMSAALAVETTDAIKEPMFQGSYKIIEVLDADMAAIIMPAGEFRLTLEATKDFWRSGNYDMHLALGNRMGGKLTVAVPQEGDGLKATERKVRIGPVRSTMMMPPEAVFRLEMALTDSLPGMETIELHADETPPKLVLQGSKGKLVCEQVD
jgi:hypothetical protein